MFLAGKQKLPIELEECFPKTLTFEGFDYTKKEAHWNKTGSFIELFDLFLNNLKRLRYFACFTYILAGCWTMQYRCKTYRNRCPGAYHRDDHEVNYQFDDGSAPLKQRKRIPTDQDDPEADCSASITIYMPDTSTKALEIKRNVSNYIYQYNYEYL